MGSSKIDTRLIEAVKILQEMDAYLDFGTPWEAGETVVRSDPSGVNEVWAKAKAFLDEHENAFAPAS